LKKLLGHVVESFRPDEEYPYLKDTRLKLDQNRLSFIIGLVALSLPAALIAATFFPSVCSYNAISDYYYSPFFSDVFAGSLVFIGALLFAFKGKSKNDGRLASLAGIAAIFTALFPTEGNGCDEATFVGRALVDLSATPEGKLEILGLVQSKASALDLFQLFPASKFVHGLSALILFAFMAWYCFVVFTHRDDSQMKFNDRPNDEKIIRDRIYRISGSIIVTAIFYIGIKNVASPDFWDRFDLTFWFEVAALWAFGFSWMTHGRFFNRALLDPREKQCIIETES